MEVVALFIGEPQDVALSGGTLYTGGAKAAAGEAYLTRDGFEGDGQGNLTYHGGRDRTACVYVAERYTWWKVEEDCDLPFGAFSENLTISGATEDVVCIGDIFRVGDALVQVSLPSDPCRTIDRISGVPGLRTRARDSGACGFHMWTLREGLVPKGRRFTLEERHPEGITAAVALALYHGRSRDAAIAARLQRMPELGAEGKRAIDARLAEWRDSAPATPWHHLRRCYAAPGRDPWAQGFSARMSSRRSVSSCGISTGRRRSSPHSSAFRFLRSRCGADRARRGAQHVA